MERIKELSIYQKKYERKLEIEKLLEEAEADFEQTKNYINYIFCIYLIEYIFQSTYIYLKPLQLYHHHECFFWLLPTYL